MRGTSTNLKKVEFGSAWLNNLECLGKNAVYMDKIPFLTVKTPVLVFVQEIDKHNYCAKSRLVSVLVVYLNRLPTFLAFTLLSRPWLQVCFATETFVLMWTRPAETSPASVSWGGFWLCNFLSIDKKFGAHTSPKSNHCVDWEKNVITFPYSDPFSIQKENVLVYDAWLRCVVCYQCDPNPPATVLTQVFATPNLEKDLTFSTEKKAVEQSVELQQWTYLGRLSAFRLRFWENSTINFIYLP